MINPELIAGMLFLPSMADNEAIEIVGTERFSNYTGWAYYPLGFNWDFCQGVFESCHMLHGYNCYCNWICFLSLWFRLILYSCFSSCFYFRECMNVLIHGGLLSVCRGIKKAKKASLIVTPSLLSSGNPLSYHFHWIKMDSYVLTETYMPDVSHINSFNLQCFWFWCTKMLLWTLKVLFNGIISWVIINIKMWK